MKRVTLAMALIVAASAIAHGQTNDQALKPEANIEWELRTLRREFFDAQRRGNRAALERLIADGFTFVHSTGVVEARQEYIDRTAAVANASRQAEIEFLDERVRVYEGRTAVWTTRSVSRIKGGSIETNFRGTDVLVKIRGRWQWISVHSTKLPTRPKGVVVAHSVYKSYVGQYEIGAGRALTVTEAGGTLRGLAAGIRQSELIPKSETQFIWFSPDSNVDSQITFVKDGGGRVTHAAFRREGEEVWRAKKIK